MEIGTLWWWIYGGISMFLVCFAGIMSGLTLGLMSLGLMDLEVLQRSGTPLERKQAGMVFVSSLSLSRGPDHLGFDQGSVDCIIG